MQLSRFYSRHRRSVQHATNERLVKSAVEHIQIRGCNRVKCDLHSSLYVHANVQKWVLTRTKDMTTIAPYTGSVFQFEPISRRTNFKAFPFPLPIDWSGARDSSFAKRKDVSFRIFM